MTKPTFLLQIQTREGVVFNSQIESLTSFNKKGRFDILPHHINYISIIENQLIIKEAGGNEKVVKLFAGLLQFINNEAKVFLGFKK